MIQIWTSEYSNRVAYKKAWINIINLANKLEQAWTILSNGVRQGFQFAIVLALDLSGWVHVFMVLAIFKREEENQWMETFSLIVLEGTWKLQSHFLLCYKVLISSLVFEFLFYLYIQIIMKWRNIIIYWCFVGEAGFSNYFRISWIISAAVFIVTVLIDSNSSRLLIIQTTCSSTFLWRSGDKFQKWRGDKHFAEKLKEDLPKRTLCMFTPTCQGYITCSI